MLEELFNSTFFTDVTKQINRAVPSEFYFYLPYLERVDDIVFEIIRKSLPQNRIEFEATLIDEGEAEYVGRIARLDVDKDHGVLVLYLQNNIKVIAYPKKLNKKLSDLVKDFKGASLVYLNIAVRRGRKLKRTSYYIQDYDILAKQKANISDLMAFKQKNHLKNWELLLMATGLYPSRELLKLYVPRFIPLFKINTLSMNSYNHVLQFTLPGTGKTMFFSKLALVCNLEILSKFPSRAKLIADARGGKLGLVFFRNGIVIDAFDKELQDKQKLEEFFTYTETGMANALWSLEKASNVEIRQEHKDVGFIFLGNIEGSLDILELTQKQLKTTRHYLRDFLHKIGVAGGLIVSFIDRLAIVDVNDYTININDYVTNYVMKAQYMKALLDYIEEQANIIQVDTTRLSELKGRYYTYGLRVAKILRALEIEPAEELALKLVRGDWDWQSLVRSDNEVKNPEELFIDQSKIQWQNQ